MGGYIDDLGDVEEWTEEMRVAEPERTPLVLHFRPQRIVQVSSEHLERWAKLFQEEFGIRPVFDDDDGPYGPQPTISGSGDGWDDCD